MTQTDPRIICITGTDTDVGKSLVTAGLLRAISRTGHPVRAIKPVQTGCVVSGGKVEAPDVALYQEAAPGVPCLALELLREPCSPHLAAKLEGRELSADALATAIMEKAAAFQGITLVEGAGGLFVPLNSRECCIDLFERLRAPIMLVAANRLGAVNHSLLSLETLHRRDLAPFAVILNETKACSTQGEPYARMVEDNPAIIAELSGIAPPLCLPFMAGFDSQNPETREAAWDILCACLHPLKHFILEMLCKD